MKKNLHQNIFSVRVDSLFFKNIKMIQLGGYPPTHSLDPDDQSGQATAPPETDDQFRDLDVIVRKYASEETSLLNKEWSSYKAALSEGKIYDARALALNVSFKLISQGIYYEDFQAFLLGVEITLENLRDHLVVTYKNELCPDNERRKEYLAICDELIEIEYAREILEDTERKLTDSRVRKLVLGLRDKIKVLAVNSKPSE